MAIVYFGDGTGHGPLLRRGAEWYRRLVSGAADAPNGWLVAVSSGFLLSSGQ
jgi:hypothetical protein